MNRLSQGSGSAYTLGYYICRLQRREKGKPFRSSLGQSPINLLCGSLFIIYHLYSIASTFHHPGLKATPPFQEGSFFLHLRSSSGQSPKRFSPGILLFS